MLQGRKTFLQSKVLLSSSRLLALQEDREIGGQRKRASAGAELRVQRAPGVFR